MKKIFSELILVFFYLTISVNGEALRSIDQLFPKFPNDSPALFKEVSTIASQSSQARAELENLAQISSEPSEGALLRASMKYAALLSGFDDGNMKRDFPYMYTEGKPIAVFWDSEIGGNIVWGDPSSLLFQEWTTNKKDWKKSKFNNATFPQDEYCEFPSTMTIQEIGSEKFLVGNYRNRTNAASKAANRIEVKFKLFRETGMELFGLKRFETPISRDAEKREIYGAEALVSEKSFTTEHTETVSNNNPADLQPVKPTSIGSQHATKRSDDATQSRWGGGHYIWFVAGGALVIILIAGLRMFLKKG